MKPSSKHDVVELVLSAARALRSAGVRVSVSEAIEAINVMEAYLSLSQAKLSDLSLEEVLWLLESTLVKRDQDERVSREAIVKALVKPGVHSMLRAIERDLKVLGLRFGEQVPRSVAKIKERKWVDQRKYLAYVRLRKLGIITRSKGKEVVLSKKRALQLLSSLPSGQKGLDQAADKAFWARMARSPRSAIREYDVLSEIKPDRDTIESLESPIIEELCYTAEKLGNKDLLQHAAEELRRRIELGYKARNPQKVAEILEKTGNATPRAMLLLSATDSTLLRKTLKYDQQRLLEAIDRLSDREKEKVISLMLKSCRDKGLLMAMISTVSETLLRREAKLLNLSNDELRAFKALSRASSALRALSQALSSGNMGYFDLALHDARAASSEASSVLSSSANAFASKLAFRALSIAKDVEKACSEAQRGNVIAAISIMTRHVTAKDLFDVIRGVLRYSADEKIRREALALLYRSWRISSRRVISGAALKKREYVIRGRGLIDIRRSLRRYLTYAPNPMVCKVKSKRRKHVLVVDVSGSMRDYAYWALLISSASAPGVKRLVLFSSNIEVIEYSKLKPERIVDVLLATEFRGFTDLIGALREATKGLSASNMIVISDLKQTVARDVKVHEEASKLVRRGWKVVMIVPPDHDFAEAEKCRDVGARVLVVDNPKEVLRIVSRIVR